MKETELTPVELGRLRKAFASVPFLRLLDIKLGEAERGSATLYLDARDELGRMEGIMHGGAIASLIDTAAAFAVLTLLEPGQKTSTVDLTVHYLHPVLQGRIRARARVLRAGRRLVSVAVEVRADGEALIATALTTYVKRGASADQL
jgi:acyl-CoA thioesterase